MHHLNQLFYNSSSSQNEDVISLHNDLITLHKRTGSRQWQCRFKLPNNKWHSTSTGQDDLGQAKSSAEAIYGRCSDLVFQELNLKTRTYQQLAQDDLAVMKQALRDGTGKRIFRDYKFVLHKYLIPFFGRYQITEITIEIVKEFDSWRISEMGRDPQASTKRTHATAHNRVIAQARLQNLIARDYNVPVLDASGAKGQVRPAFNKEEINKLLAYMPSWELEGRSSRTRELRQLCRCYVEFLINTGARPGTELDPMRWRHLQWHWIGDQRYLKVWLSGKTGPRFLIAKNQVINTLERIIRWHQLPYPDLDSIIKAKVDRLIFTFPRGAKPYNFNPQFENLLNECGLLKDVAGCNRSLYSLRHTYATFALAEGVDIHTLSRQMGTSTLMIERHYSKLTPMMAAEKLA